jgi:hypothetical protein
VLPGSQVPRKMKLNMDSMGAMHQWLTLAEKKYGITNHDDAQTFTDNGRELSALAKAIRERTPNAEDDAVLALKQKEVLDHEIGADWLKLNCVSIDPCTQKSSNEDPIFGMPLPALASVLLSGNVTIRTSSILDPPLLSLRFRSTRVYAAQASVCWRTQSTVDSLFFIDVPTNPGPRSFCARPVRRCRCAGQPMLSIALKPAP